MEIDLNEVLRYMGSRGREMTDGILSTVNSVCRELEAAASPQYVYRIFSTDIGENTVKVGGVCFSSKRLATHLRGCKKAAILAATLGTQADTVIRRAALSGTVNASAAQAAGAAMIEQVLDEAVDAIKTESGLNARPRFSPGYSDWQLSSQRDMLALCDAQKRIGITLTDTLLMIPTKSVTAIVGLTNDACKSKGGCSECDKKDCDFRL